MADEVKELTKAPTTTREMAANNTDRELWREREGDFYADSIHVTASGGVGIDCGGSVIVRPLREWHRLALRALDAEQQIATLTAERDQMRVERDALREKLRELNRAAQRDEDILLGSWLQANFFFLADAPKEGQ